MSMSAALKLLPPGPVEQAGSNIQPARHLICAKQFRRFGRGPAKVAVPPTADIRLRRSERRFGPFSAARTRSKNSEDRPEGQSQTCRSVRDILPLIAAGMIPCGTGQMAVGIGRRQFISALGGTAAMWPLAAHSQQSAMPAVGFLHIGSPGRSGRQLVEFRKGLSEAGYIEGRNVAVEYRWVEGQFDRLPALIDDLVRRHVAVIAAYSLPTALAAKAATATIPVVFEIGGDPVKLGLVDSLNRPGGTFTGFTQFGNILAPKQFELLHEAVPKAVKIGMFVNPNNPNALSDARAVRAAAEALGLQVFALNVTGEHELEANFATLVENGVGGLLVSITLSLGSLSDQTIALAAHYAIPAIYAFREEAAAGGLMSYGTDEAVTSYQVGSYVGCILKGEKPADLPVQQTTKVELIINLKTAKALGLSIPLPLLGRADEVIE